MSAISSTTAASLFPLRSQLNPQNQAATSPADALLASEVAGENQGSDASQSNIFAVIAALNSFNSPLQQSPGTQDALTAFLGTLEQNGVAAPGTTVDGGTTANSSASPAADLSAIAASGNDTTSQQAAVSQLLSLDAVTSNQLQMDLLTALLGSSNLSTENNTNSDAMFPEPSQNSAPDSPLNFLA